jgi:hypothetical protein
MNRILSTGLKFGGALASAFLGLRTYDQRSLVCLPVLSMMTYQPVYLVQDATTRIVAAQWNLQILGAPPLPCGVSQKVTRSFTGGQFTSPSLNVGQLVFDQASEDDPQCASGATSVVQDRLQTYIAVGLYFLNNNEGPSDIEFWMLPYGNTTTANTIAAQDEQFANDLDVKAPNYRPLTNMTGDMIDELIVGSYGYDFSMMFSDGYRSNAEWPGWKTVANENGEYLIVACQGANPLLPVPAVGAQVNSIFTRMGQSSYPDAINGYVLGQVSWLFDTNVKKYRTADALDGTSLN